MNKIFVIFIFLFIYPNNLYSKEIDTIFGLSLYSKIFSYVDREYYNSNKVKFPERKDLANYVNITKFITSKSPYFEMYTVVTDANDNIEAIGSRGRIKNLDNCLEVMNSLKMRIEQKYNINFKNKKIHNKNMIAHHRFYYTSNENFFGLQCNKYLEDNLVLIMLNLETSNHAKKINEFYNSGF